MRCRQIDYWKNLRRKERRSVTSTGSYNCSSPRVSDLSLPPSSMANKEKATGSFAVAPAAALATYSASYRLSIYSCRPVSERTKKNTGRPEVWL